MDGTTVILTTPQAHISTVCLMHMLYDDRPESFAAEHVAHVVIITR